jgi:RNA polymerase sigma factor (sigma-70 family)
MFRGSSAVTGSQAVKAQQERCEEVRLLERIAGGDARAFEELYRIYHPRLTRFLMNMTRRAHLMEEVLDDTMMVVWERPHSYAGASKLSTWIFAIAYRKALKAMRKYDEPIEDEFAEARPSGEPGPVQQLERLQAREVLFGAIGELSADQRAVVELAYFHEIGYREIAEIMNCPADTVKTRMFHARQRLKAKLAGALGDWL